MTASVLCLALLAGAALGAAPAPQKPLKLSPDANRKFHELDAQRRNVSWHKQRIPDHIKGSAHMLRSIPVVEAGGCGKKIPASALGLKRSAMAVEFFKNPSFLQVEAQRKLRGGAPEHPGRNSMSKPGVGVEQEVADDGMSTIGKVTGSEPYVTVLKDGWFEVGCYTDAMLEFGDKYGNGKFKYKMGESTNVSIAKYSELILKDEKKPMTPTLCFEFCRTLPGMVFFGINAGNDCYCEPFFKPATSDAAQCDQPCEGDPTSMCGNMAAKSTIWEMHLCADTATDLSNAMTASKEALDFFFENALLANDLGTKMSATAEKLEEVAGVSGSKTAADSARSANGASKFLTQAYQKGAKTYATLLGAYNDGKGIEGSDFTDAKQIVVAEHAIATMKPTTGEVLGEAAEIHFLNQLAYPLADAVVFGDAPDSADAMATMLAKIKASPVENINFRDVAYAMGETTFEPEASSCFGPTIGSPIMGMGLAGCAGACEATVAPENCVAFGLYNVDGLTDLCLLFSDVKAIETFECSGDAQGKGAPAGAKCMVKMSEISTGYKPKAEMKKYPRCFSTEKAYGIKAEMTDLSLPGDSELKVGSGAPLVKAE